MSDRRGFLGSALTAGAGLLAAPALLRAAAQCADPFAGGRLVGTLPLYGLGGVEHPLERMLGRGLDARLATDLSQLTPETLIVPSERFFVRSDVPPGVAGRTRWTIRASGLVREPGELALESLAPLVVPRGAHLIECAGNNNPANFGLMSAATWSGVPLVQVLERLRPLPAAKRVVVSGVDPVEGRSRSSVPGASWSFSLAEIERWQPFLATQMNGAPLLPVHGAPVRLVMPRWYGCASIKWVDAIELAPDDAAATPQMKEFARRTLQDGVPERARDYKPAAVDLAAMPVRVEKWLVDGRLGYRVVGVTWGGESLTNSLQIAFGDDVYGPLAMCPKRASNDTWSLWSHPWQPKRPGRYKIVLKSGDPKIAARRLDLYYYIREVRVDEV